MSLPIRFMPPGCPAGRPSTGSASGAVLTSVAVQLDPDALNRLRDLDPRGQGRLIARVLCAFEASLQRMLPELVRAGRSEDLPTVKLIVHTLKSSAAIVGATAMAQQCTDIEVMLRENRLHSLLPCIDALLVEATGVRAALQQVPEHAA